MSLLGIDIGSSSCKGVVFSNSGEILTQASESYSIKNTAPSMAEIEAIKFRDAVFNIINSLSKNITSDPIEALAVSSHGETIIPVDKNGDAIGHAIMNSDNRAIAEAEWWDDTFGKERIYEITGLPLHAMFSLNKILWLKNHNFNLYTKTERFLSAGDYILCQLGLPSYTDYSLASRTMAFDINKHCWSEDILKHCGISKEKLGIPVVSGTVAGKLSKNIASKLGLKEGTYVATGGHDQPCGALGAGVINPGEISDSAGTYECLVSASEKPCNNSKSLVYHLNSYCHVVENRYVTLSFFPAGFVIDWFIQQLCDADKMIAKDENINIFELLNMKVLDIPEPTGICITPHFIGSCNPHWDVKATGSIIGLTPSVSRYHLYKAIFEGLACELALNVSALEEITGEFNSIRIFGGNARSAFTLQLRADITQKKIQTLNHSEAVCHGAALLAGIAAKVYKNAEDAVKQTVKFSNIISPDKEMSLKYQKQLEQYKLIYPSLEEIRMLR